MCNTLNENRRSSTYKKQPRHVFQRRFDLNPEKVASPEFIFAVCSPPITCSPPFFSTSASQNMAVLSLVLFWPKHNVIGMLWTRHLRHLRHRQLFQWPGLSCVHSFSRVVCCLSLPRFRSDFIQRQHRPIRLAYHFNTAGSPPSSHLLPAHIGPPVFFYFFFFILLVPARHTDKE